MKALFLSALVLLAGCAAHDKEAVIAAGLAGGVAACDALLADPTVQATPEARAWCKRLVNGCHDDGALLNPY